MQFIKELWIKNYIIFCLFLIFMLIGIYIWVVYPKGGELLDIALYRNDFLDGLFPLITLMGEAYVYVLAALIAIIYNNKICFIFVSILGTQINQ